MAGTETYEYLVRAAFTANAVNYYFSTEDEQQVSGNDYHGVLEVGTSVGRTLSAGQVPVGQAVQLAVVYRDGPSANLFAAYSANQFREGVVVLLTVRVLVRTLSGATSSFTRSQWLTITGIAMDEGQLSLTLTDVEDERLDALYPSKTLTTADFPKLIDSSVGKPVAFPVGTALKLDARLLTRQVLWDGTARQPEWLFALCELEWQTYAITAVNTGAKTFGVAGDITSQLGANDVFWVFDPASRTNITNTGKYTAVSVIFSAGTTTITVVEAIGSATVTCSVNIPPKVLAVYRDGTLVSPTEYTIEVLDNAVPAIPAGVSDFTNSGGSDWTSSSGGTGTASLAGAQAAITGDGGATNFGLVRSFAGVASGCTARRHQYAGFRATITGTGSCWMHLWQAASPIAGSGSLASAGSPARVLAKSMASISDFRVGFSTQNTGAAANLVVDNCQWDNPSVPLLMVRFTSDQIDTRGQLYRVQADVLGYRSRNAVDEISRLLTECALTLDTTSKTSAQSYATTCKMLADCAHGRDGQRTIRSTLLELLTIARGSLYRHEASASTYGIVQDRDSASLATYDATSEQLRVLRFHSSGVRPLSVAVRYKPSGIDPSSLQHTLTRNVTGGSGVAEQPVDVPLMRDHEGADRLVCWMALRRQYNRRVDFELAEADHLAGDVVTLRDPEFFTADFPVLIEQVSWNEGSLICTGVENVAAVHTYTPGTLPADAQTTYEPDYSQTFPAAPSAFSVTVNTTVVANDGTTTARVTLQSTAPAVNWSEIWFSSRHNTTGELDMVEGSLVSGTTYSATIGNLRPGESYTFSSWARNSFGRDGQTATTSTTTAGHATVPGNVASCSAAQGMGRIVNVSWPQVSASNLWGYVLERSVGGGGYAEIWRGQATNYRDTDVSIGTSQQYRVKARDTYGNISASYATSSSVTPTGNVTGGTSGNDIAGSTVASNNRTGLTTVSKSVNHPANTSSNFDSVAHGLGKVPVAVVSGHPGSLACNASAADTTWLYFTTFAFPLYDTTFEVPNNPHRHFLTSNNTLGTVSFNVW
jgi:hypothetical protein